MKPDSVGVRNSSNKVLRGSTRKTKVGTRRVSADVGLSRTIYIKCITGMRKKDFRRSPSVPDLTRERMKEVGLRDSSI